MRSLAALARRALRRARRRPQSDTIRIDVPSSNRVSVVFSRPDRDIARLDIAAGPCVPAAGRNRPLVGPFSQLDLTQNHIERLFDVLGPDPESQPWESVIESGAGRLVVFSAPFVDALVAINRAGLDRDDQVRVQGRPLTEAQAMWVIEPSIEVGAKWLQRAPWPKEATAHGVGVYVGLFGAEARVSKERGQHLYCWFGPGVPLKTRTIMRASGDPKRMVRTK